MKDNIIYQERTDLKELGRYFAEEICITIFVLRDYGFPRENPRTQPTQQTTASKHDQTQGILSIPCKIK